VVKDALRHYLRHPKEGVAAFRDIAGIWAMLQDRWMARLESRLPPCQYALDADWERRLHAAIGAPWPCPNVAEFRALWPGVIAELQEQGLRVGPESLYGWNDGDPELVRAIWCLVRHLRPATVVETGVAHGLTSRFILEALALNGAGRLWSIDLPPVDPALLQHVGAAVGDRFAERWTYLKGTSRRRLPALLAQFKNIDLFIHDSLHSRYNVLFELRRAWPALKPGGAVVVDDIDTNWGFHDFTKALRGVQALVCQSQPLRPDTRRFDSKGLFGIVLKPAEARR